MPDKVAVSPVNEVIFIAEFLDLVLADIGDARGDRLVDLHGGARLGRRHKGDGLAEAVARREFL